MSLPIRVETRTGDTPHERKVRQRVHPPQMLLTTPESLSLLLSHEDSSLLFANLRTVVVDEIHAFATGKRGDLLSLAMARLQQLALALPRGTLGHQHALAMGIGEHRGRALPADQPVVARDQQLAHVVGMEEAEIVQAEQPLVDHVAITPLQVAEMAQVVPAQREDLGQPAPAGGRTRNGNGDRQDMAHGRASWRRHGVSS